MYLLREKVVVQTHSQVENPCNRCYVASHLDKFLSLLRDADIKCTHYHLNNATHLSIPRLDGFLFYFGDGMPMKLVNAALLIFHLMALSQCRSLQGLSGESMPCR